MSCPPGLCPNEVESPPKMLPRRSGKVDRLHVRSRAAIGPELARCRGEVGGSLEDDGLIAGGEEADRAVKVLAPRPQREADRLVTALFDDPGGGQVAEAVVVVPGHP